MAITMFSKLKVFEALRNVVPYSKTESFKHRSDSKSQSIQFGTTHTKKGPGRYPVKAKGDR